MVDDSSDGLEKTTTVNTFSKYGLWFPAVGALISFIVFAAGATVTILLQQELSYTIVSVLSIMMYTTWGLWAVLGWRAKKLTVKQVFNKNGLTSRMALTLLAAAFIAQAATIAGSIIIGDIAGRQVEGNAAEAVPEDLTFLTISLLVILTVIVAPLFEEIMFRSLIFDGIINTLRKLRSPETFTTVFALTVSSILFGLSHVVLNIFQGFNLNSIVTLTVTTLLGLYLGYLRIKHNNLTLNVIVHSLFNAIAIVLLLAATLLQ